MLFKDTLLVALLASKISAQKTQSLYGQCGGQSYTGLRACPSGAICYNDGNPWYSQCILPENAGPKPPVATTTQGTTITVGEPDPTTVTTTVTFLTPTTTPAPPAGSTSITSITITLTPDDPFTDGPFTNDPFTDDLGPAPTPDPDAEPTALPRSEPGVAPIQQASGPGTTLQAGWYWIRAVASPNFHQYLQTTPANGAGPALLGSHTTAGQYKVIDGQLVVANNTGPAYLYMHVERPPADPNLPTLPRTLATAFNDTENTFGTFAFEGDALTWSGAPEVDRQNRAAWLVCAGQRLFVNTGAYGYQTPGGCVDQTIHYYNDVHANGK